ncbi:T9SS type A sorting domain-containing protein [Bacteroidota bacterium]
MKRIALNLAVIFLIFSSIIVLFHLDSDRDNKEENKTYPYEWAWMQRTFPYFDADPAAQFDAIKEARILREETHKKYLRSGQSLAEWQFAGPDNIGGRVVDIEFNPQNPEIVYAAGATGGVLKSTDMGNSWFPIFDDQASLTIGDIAIDPLHPDTIYVGTGEANGGHNNFPGAGIFKSTDAGLTWEHIGLEHIGLENTASIGRIIIDPVNPQRIFVAAVGSYFKPTPDRGIYFSDDGGDNWTISLFVSDSTGAIDIVMDPTDPNFMMAAMWERVRRPASNHLYGPTSGIYRTFDGGENWTLLDETNGLPSNNAFYGNNPGIGYGRVGLAMCQSQPNISYALINDSKGYVGLYRTNDYGTTWFDADIDDEFESGGFDFSWFFGQVRVHPIDPNIVYVLDISFMRSSNGGEDVDIRYGYSGDYRDELHVDHHALAFNPDDPDYIISGNDGGINISTDGGESWSNHAHIPLTQFYEIGIDYNKPERLYGGTQDNNTIRTTTGALDDWSVIYGGDGFYVIVDSSVETDTTIIYAESQNGGLIKLTEIPNGNMDLKGAKEGVDGSDPVNWSMPVVMDPNNNNVLYLGTNRIYRTINKADFWEPISEDLTNGPYQTSLGTVSAIAVAPSDTNVIYAGTDDGNLWVSDNYGTGWNQIIDEVLPLRWITRIVVDPADAGKVYVTYSGLKWMEPQPHVFKSEDMGENWVNISSNLPDAPVNAFAVDLYNSNVLYLGNDVGAYISRNGGISWDVLGSGIPIVPVADMKIHPVENYLVIGTYGRSMYKIDLAEVTGVENQSESLPVEFALYQNYPNPFNPATTIKFQLSKASNITLTIYDVLGREISKLLDKEFRAGIHQVEFNGEDISSGVYFYTLETKDNLQTKKMILLK